VRLDRAGGEGRLSNELMSRVAERSGRTAPAGHGQSWAMLAAHYEGIKGLLGQGVTVVKAGELLAAVTLCFPSGRCTVTRWRSWATGAAPRRSVRSHLG